jgi:transglutaminase-like putative cysteine protease
MLARVVVPVSSQGGIQVLLDTLTVLNGVYLAARPDVPHLYDSGVRYKREDGREDWLTIPLVIRRGYGDCEDLSAWLAADYRRKGIQARAIVYRAGSRVWHVVVQMPDGSIEDPSKRLGMNAP